MKETKYRWFKSLVLLCAALLCGTVVHAQKKDVSAVWVSDQGDGTYVNPVLHADYSDPDVCAVGSDFYMTASSFNCIPGLPILHSKDLVNWKLINHALKVQLPKEYFHTPRHGKGVWAPSIRYYKNEYYIFWGDPDFGIYRIKAKDPAGEWSEPLLVKAGKGMIDVTPLWDEDGRVYIVHAWAGSRSGINSILTVTELDQKCERVLSDPVMVFDGNATQNHTVEGPKFYKRNGYYYIMAPAGGVEQGWQLAMRSKDIYGPYEVKRVMAQGNTTINGPHQGGWVDTQTGESWFVHFQDKKMYGRVIHLNPVKWTNDWPVIGTDSDGDGCGEPVTRYKKPNVGAVYPIQTPVESDEFDARQLGLQWQWHANYQDHFGFPSQMGSMRIYGHTLSDSFINFWEVPNLLLQKFPAEEFTATTKVKISALEEGEKAGLIVMGWNYSYLALVKNGDRFVLEQTLCKEAEQLNPEQTIVLESFPAEPERNIVPPLFSRTIFMRLTVNQGGRCIFAFSNDGKTFTPIGQPFQARQGKWIGAKVGIFATNPSGASKRGWVDVDWFRITK